MSFELYVGAFKTGESAAFPSAIVDGAFGPFVRRKEAGCWILEYSDGGAPEIYIEDGPEIAGFSVSRPPRSPEFWTALLQVLRQAHAVCYWPGGERPIVAEASDARELPEEMAEALGWPVEVLDGAAFRAEVER